MYLFVVWSLLLILSGCWNNSEDNKQDFFVDMFSFNSMDQGVFISKPGRVLGSQDVVVSSQVSGRIKSIEKKDWDNVSWEQLIISIADTVANYWLQVQRAKSAISRASLQKQQTQVSLEKSINDVSTALDVAKNNYNVSKLTTEQSLKKAELDFSSANAQSDGIYLQFDLERNNALNVIDTILNQMDTYLWVTDEYKSINIYYEPYLWGNDIWSKANAKKYVEDLYLLRKKISELPANTQDAKVVMSGISMIEQWYNKSNLLLDTMKIVLTNSIVTNVLTQQMIDWYRARVDGLLGSLQWAKTSLSAYRRQVNSLLTQWSSGFVEVAKSQAQIGYDMARINSHNTIYSTEVWVKNAETSYNSLLKNNDIQLGMANNAIQDANITYQDALSRFNNLTVEAPIPWVIWNVSVDVWQEVGPWTPLFTVSNNNQQTVEVYVTAEERWYLSFDQSVKISYGWLDFTWYIFSVSSVADKNTLYKVVVGFDDTVSLLGGIASVKLPVSLPFQVLPINVITPVNENKWFIWIYNGTGIQRQTVILWRVWDSYVEIYSWIFNGMKIITTDVSYFDPSKFSLKF